MASTSVLEPPSESPTSSPLKERPAYLSLLDDGDNEVRERLTKTGKESNLVKSTLVPQKRPALPESFVAAKTSPPAQFRLPTEPLPKSGSDGDNVANLKRERLPQQQQQQQLLFQNMPALDQFAMSLNQPGAITPRTPNEGPQHMRDRKNAATTSVLETFRLPLNQHMSQTTDSIFGTDEMIQANKRRQLMNRRSVTDHLPFYNPMPAMPMQYPQMFMGQRMYPNMGVMGVNVANSMQSMSGMQQPMGAQNGMLRSSDFSLKQQNDSRRGKRGKDLQKRKNRVCSFCSIRSCPNSAVCKGRGGRKYCDCCANE